MRGYTPLIIWFPLQLTLQLHMSGPSEDMPLQCRTGDATRS